MRLDRIGLARDLDVVSVTLTCYGHVSSDIVSKAFTSGLQTPEFYSRFHRTRSAPT